MIGLLNLHKPVGETSRDVVNRVQRLVRPIKVGHTGTLDPLAEGVLVLCLGPATRLASYVQRMRKRYRARFLLGQSSETDDTQGVVTVIAGARPISEIEICDLLPAFRGPIMQRPPAYSALKVSGKRAYQLARTGKVVQLPAREVMIHDLQLVALRYPELILDIECGSGTYVRALGRDIAERLGSAAVMAALTRVAVGPFKIEAALDPATLTHANLPEYTLDPLHALQGLPMVRLRQQEIVRLRHGQAIDLPPQAEESPDQEFAAVDAEGRLVAVVSRRSSGEIRAVCNLA